MRALVLTNAYYRAEEYMYAPRRIAEELNALGVEAKIRANDFFPFSIEGGDIVSAIPDIDFIVYYDKDKYVAAAAERAGIPLYNGAEAIRLADDKAECAIRLAGEGIPMPKTMPGLMCYRPEAALKEGLEDEVLGALGSPVVVKECYGSRGRGVYLARNAEELSVIAEKVKTRPHLFQEFIGESAGRDVRVMVAGERVLGAIERRSEGDFRANVSLGGTARAIEAGEELSAAALKAARVLGLDYCGVDFLVSGEKFYLTEVNSNPFFGGFERATGINAAREIAETILCPEREKLST